MEETDQVQKLPHNLTEVNTQTTWKIRLQQG